MKKLALVLAVLSVIIISGCVEEPPVTPTEGYGLEINDFSSDQESVYSDRSVRLSMEVENKGDTEVLDNHSMVYLIGSNLDLDDDTGVYWSGSSTDETLFKHIGKDLKAADPSRGILGDTKTFVWRLQAPVLARGQNRTDEFIGRVYYEYETVARGTVWTYSETEEEAVRTAGGEFDKSNFTSTVAPLQVEVSIAPDPPVLSDADKFFTMYLKISNAGGGTVYKPNIVDYHEGSEDIALAVEDLNKVEVLMTGITGLTITGCLDEQELIGGRDTTLVCDVQVDSDYLPATKKGFSPTITIKYGYYEDEKVPVTVMGR